MNADDIKLGKYLCHYGVKGMHWGEWNEETRRRRTRYVYGDKFKGEKIADDLIRKIAEPMDPQAYNDYKAKIDKGELVLPPRGLNPRYGNLNFWYGLNSFDRTDAQDWRHLQEDNPDEPVSVLPELFRVEVERTKMPPEDISEAYKKVNQLHGAPGYDDNCMACSIAGVFRAKGFDVEAESSMLDDYHANWGDNKVSQTMMNSEYCEKIFKKPYNYPSQSPEYSGLSLTRSQMRFEEASPDKEEAFYNVEQHIKSKTGDSTVNMAQMALYSELQSNKEQFPEGSYGVICGNYADDIGGHITDYKIENGEMYIYDGQNRERSIGYEGVKHYHPESLKYMRLDDADMDNIDYNALYEWSGLRPARPKGYS